MSEKLPTFALVNKGQTKIIFYYGIDKGIYRTAVQRD
jgi:hypothetical protein